MPVHAFAGADQSELLRDGWALVRAHADNENELSSLVVAVAQSLGRCLQNKRGSLVAEIAPRKATQGNPASLSGKYGYGVFPLHSDTAHWTVPCRFVVIGCRRPGASPVPTLLLDTADLGLSAGEQALASSALFFVRNGRRSFYSSILSPRRYFARCDPGCMEPVDDKGIAALNLYSIERHRVRVISVLLRTGEILILDNWRILHGRAAVGLDTDRLLLRCIVQ